MHDALLEGTKFIDLTWISVAFLFTVGFIGGLVSGFIGSGGAFVLTPGMASQASPARFHNRPTPPIRLRTCQS